MKGKKKNRNQQKQRKNEWKDKEGIQEKNGRGGAGKM